MMGDRKRRFDNDGTGAPVGGEAGGGGGGGFQPSVLGGARKQRIDLTDLHPPQAVATGASGVGNVNPYTKRSYTSRYVMGGVGGWRAEETWMEQIVVGY